MKYQFFGGKATKPADKLKSVRPNMDEMEQAHGWGLDPVSALRVPIIASRKKAQKSFSLAGLNEAIRLKKLGIYSISKDFSRQLVEQLSASDIDVFSFTAEQELSPCKIETVNSMDAWLIHMDDEDESPLLDSILGVGSQVASLFLFEQNLTKQCLNKIDEFMLETRQAS